MTRSAIARSATRSLPPARQQLETMLAMSMPRQPHFALMLVAAWLLVVLQLVMQDWSSLTVVIGDSDDAMRLVQVHRFLAGQGWFDLHEARTAPPLGYDSHWSRLIDAGLVGLFLAFRTITDAALAERLMLAVWPVLWLVSTIGAVAAVAWRLGGREAALVVLLLAVLGVPGWSQYRLGRIDHHNVQIALALLAVATTVWSDRVRWAGGAAGAATGLALAIGLEGMPLLVLCGTALTLRYMLDADAAPALRHYGSSLAVGALAAFLVTVPPEHWGQVACDAIAINSAAAVVAAGVALAAAATLVTGTRLSTRCLAGAAAGVLALAVFALIEPRCLGGPYALVDAGVRSVWLDRVNEMQSLFALMQTRPVTGLACAAFPATALAALAIVAPGLRRDFAFLTAGAAFLLALAIMIGMIKFYDYTLWLGAPVVAVAALDICRRLRLESMVARFVVALLLTPVTVSVAAITIASATGANTGAAVNPEREACLRRESYAALAQLPPGLVATNQVGWGPFVLAWTPHAVLAAPYHRLSASILPAHRVFAGPPDEAHAILTGMRATYVMTCANAAPALRGPGTEAPDPASLAARLRAGDVPGWLEPVRATQGKAIAVYRVTR